MDHFEFLGLISKENEAKEILDNFIKEMHKEYNTSHKSSSSTVTTEFFRDKFEKFDTLIKRLTSMYQLSDQVIKFYFNMDKVIVPIMKEYVSLGNRMYFNICTNDKYNTFRDFDGSDIHYLYYDEINEACIQLENHAHLFPETTKNYLLKKKEEREMTNFDSLDNDFQARIFVSKFDQKFKIGKFRTALKGFIKNCDWDDRDSTLLRLHDAVYKRYSGSEGKEKELMLKFLVEVADAVYRGEWWYLSQMEEEAIEHLEKIIPNKPLTDSFIQSILDYERPDIVSYLPYFISDIELKSKCEETIKQALLNDCSDNIFSIAQEDEDFINSVVERSKKQFLKKHTIMKNFLLKSGKISEDLERIY